MIFVALEMAELIAGFELYVGVADLDYVVDYLLDDEVALVVFPLVFVVGKIVG